MSIEVRLTDKALDVGALFSEFSEGRVDMGGICLFTGLVRDFNDGRAVDCLTLEHYPEMAEKQLHRICAEAIGRWDLGRLWVIHRYGDMVPGDVIVVVLAGCVHRAEAFDACRFVMDYLKVEAPFWKLEKSGGIDYRVGERDSDKDAVKRWGG